MPSALVQLGKEPFVVLMRDGWVGDRAAARVRQALRAEMRFYLRAGILAHHPGFESPEM